MTLILRVCENVLIILLLRAQDKLLTRIIQGTNQGDDFGTCKVLPKFEAK